MLATLLFAMLLSASSVRAEIGGDSFLTVESKAPDLTPVLGVCVLITNVDTLYQEELCDGSEQDPLDGVVQFSELIGGGQYTVEQTFVEFPFLLAAAQQVMIEPDTFVVFENQIEDVQQYQEVVKPVVAVNAADEPIGGACWEAFQENPVPGTINYVSGCDDDLDGTVYLVVSQGVHYDHLVETQAPAGYQMAPPTDMNGNELPRVIVHFPLENIAADLGIFTRDTDENLLAGACYSVTAEGVLPIAACDVDDGLSDGITLVPALSVGVTYNILQTATPFGYKVAVPSQVTIVEPCFLCNTTIITNEAFGIGIPSVAPSRSPGVELPSPVIGLPSVAPSRSPESSPSTCINPITGGPCADPSDEPSDRPGDEPSDRPGDEPSDRPGDEPSDRPGDEPSDRPGDEPSDRPGDEPSPAMVSTPELTTDLPQTGAGPDASTEGFGGVLLVVLVAAMAVCAGCGLSLQRRLQ
jgi:hypothetical protein